MRLGCLPVAFCMNQPCRSIDQNLQMGPHTYESIRAETKQHCSDSLIARVHTILLSHATGERWAGTKTPNCQQQTFKFIHQYIKPALNGTSYFI